MGEGMGVEKEVGRAGAGRWGRIHDDWDREPKQDGEMMNGRERERVGEAGNPDHRQAVTAPPPPKLAFLFSVPGAVFKSSS